MTATRLFSRALIRIAPRNDTEDVGDFLQGLVTSDVAHGLPVWAGLLTPQGKVLFDFLVWPAGKALLVDCEADAADDLVKRLSLYRLRRAIHIARDDTLAVHWRPHNGCGAASDPRLPALGERWIAPATPEDKSADDAWREHRLSLGVTEGRAELGHGETLWLECNAVELHGVSFDKGCYVGQENTARMNWRQKVNRRLLVMPLDRSDPARQRIAYPDLGLAVDHLRVEDVDVALWPEWLRAALNTAAK
jgi:folate-binding protein YgfZ